MAHADTIDDGAGQSGRDPRGPTDTIHDVAVVGAGISGLIAARELSTAGLDVVVVDAADRAGGRTLAVTSALGSRLDLGGQWIGAGHHRFAALADEFGATRFDTHSPALPVLADDEGVVRPVAPTALLAVSALARVELFARLPGRHRRNAVTMQSWIGKMRSARARRLLEVLFAVATTGDTDRTSLGAFAAFARFQGGLTTMMSTTGGAQEALVAEGAGTLSERLAAGLGDRIRLNTRVTAIDDGPGGVTLTTTTGPVHARTAIVTLPPPLLRDVTFTPPLPTMHADLVTAMYMGSVYKAVAVYPRPFWRDRDRGPGYAEYILFDEPGVGVFDTSPPGGPGHLCFLVGGSDARSLDALDEDARRASLLGRLARHLGPEVCEPADWHEKAWHQDPCAGGGYTALPLAGRRADFPLPAAPAGRLYWAGAERADEHPGYIEGALQAGQRAAREVLTTLSPQYPADNTGHPHLG